MHYRDILTLEPLTYLNQMGEERTEVWRTVEGFARYEVSDLGRVKSIERITCGKRYAPIVLKQSLKDTGYLTVNLFNSAKKFKICKVHRLVALNFIPNVEAKKTVNHKDLDKLNNTVSNLEWATHSENHLHAYSNGRIKPLLGKIGAQCKNSKTVYQFDMEGKLLNTFSGTHEAERKTGIGFRMIARVCSGARQYTNGFKWSYNLKTA